MRSLGTSTVLAADLCRTGPFSLELCDALADVTRGPPVLTFATVRRKFLRGRRGHP